MASIGTPVIRRIIEIADGPDSREQLLASVGLPSEPDAVWSGESVSEETYYDLLERVGGDRDPGLALRYGAALRAEDLGALGLAMKTAPTVEAALGRTLRYILVLTDTLEYEWVDEPGGRTFTLVGRPPLRRGAALANECAFAAVASMLRQAAGDGLSPDEVRFQHGPPSDERFHREFFGCPVVFDAPHNGVHLTTERLRQPTLLGDDGLSAYLLAQLDDLWSRRAERSLVSDVRAAVADALPDGQPSKVAIARRLGMSERTLHRRLAEHDMTFQTVVTEARRDAAESLLRSGHHSLVEVAFLTGFSEQSAFSRAFKRWTGLTPAAFREQHG